MNHLAFQVGEIFQIRHKGVNGKEDNVRICRKSSRIGFVYADEAMLGEVQFSPELDALVEPIPSMNGQPQFVAAVETPAPVAVVKKAPAKKSVAKKKAKKQAKKK